MNWTGRRVLVTGAGGFIPSHLVEALLNAGATVRALVHYNGRGDLGMLDSIVRAARPGTLEVVLGDVRDPFGVGRACADIDMVFHLAALIGIPYSYLSPADYVDTNVKGTLNVLEACRDHGVKRLVHTSTSEVYGTAQRVPIDEHHPVHPQSPYAATKLAADALVKSYHLSFDLPVITVRPFNTYGPRQSARAVLVTILSQFLGHQPLALGSLTPERDLTFVSDTVAGFLALATCDQAIGHTVNLGSGKAIAIGDLARCCMKVCGIEREIKAEPVRERPPGSEVMKLVADVRLVKELTGWKAKVDLDQGIAATWTWIQANRDRFHGGYAR